VEVAHSVEIGGTISGKRLDNFIAAIESLAKEYKDIEVKTTGEFYK
jgi:hypothetical protein